MPGGMRAVVAHLVQQMRVADVVQNWSEMVSGHA